MIAGICVVHFPIFPDNEVCGTEFRILQIMFSFPSALKTNRIFTHVTKWLRFCNDLVDSRSRWWKEHKPHSTVHLQMISARTLENILITAESRHRIKWLWMMSCASVYGMLPWRLFRTTPKCWPNNHSDKVHLATIDIGFIEAVVRIFTIRIRQRWESFYSDLGLIAYVRIFTITHFYSLNIEAFHLYYQTWLISDYMYAYVRKRSVTILNILNM